MSQKVLVIVHQCFHSSSVELSLVTSYYWGGGMLFSVTRQLARASVCFFVIFSLDPASLKSIIGKLMLSLSDTTWKTLRHERRHTIVFPISRTKALLTAHIFSWMSKSHSLLKGKVKDTTNMRCPSLCHHPEKPTASSEN